MHAITGQMESGEQKQESRAGLSPLPLFPLSLSHPVPPYSFARSLPFSSSFSLPSFSLSLRHIFTPMFLCERKDFERKDVALGTFSNYERAFCKSIMRAFRLGVAYCHAVGFSLMTAG